MTLHEKLKQYAYFTYGNNSMSTEYEREDNAKELEEIADRYAIEFAEWLATDWTCDERWTIIVDKKELLEIFKKEKGL